jgi:glycosyltransferase involved in cell wall biosynthesis
MKLSFVIPTRNRGARLRATLRSLAIQRTPPDEVIIVDASDDPEAIARARSEFAPAFSHFTSVVAAVRGAAAQRNQGVALATGEWVGFCDDDIDFEPGCVRALRDFLAAEKAFGGVSATIVNQAPRSFGRATRLVVGLMDTTPRRPLDGRVIGPVVNFLPRVCEAAEPVCETEWLPTTCTVYRRSSLPQPPFDAQFQGYSMLEDVCLSMRVARTGSRLAVLRDARIFHDTQPGDHKRSVSGLAAMGIRNRFYVATTMLGRSGLLTWWQLALWQSFCGVAGVRRAGRDWFLQNWGAVSALGLIALGRK